MNKKSAYLVIMLITLLFAGSVNAASQSQTRTQTNSAVQGSTDTTAGNGSKTTGTANKNANKEKFTAEKCETIQNRLTAKIGGYNKTNNRNYNAFLNLQARLTKVEARLRLEEGLDTTKLKTDITELDKLIEAYAKDYSLLNEQLKFTQKKTCDNTQGETQTQLTTSREQIKKVHEDRDKIRSFYAEFIKPDLIALKKQIEDSEDAAANNTTSEEDSESTENSSDTSVSNNE